jgi:hypothetical protein
MAFIPRGLPLCEQDAFEYTPRAFQPQAKTSGSQGGAPAVGKTNPSRKLRACEDNRGSALDTSVIMSYDALSLFV